MEPWRLGSNMLPTKEKMGQRIGATNKSCCLCNACVEGNSHLFFYYQVAKELYGEVLMTWTKQSVLCNPLQAKAAAFLWALQIAQSEGLKNIIVEEDSRQCVDALNSGYPLLSGLFTSFCQCLNPAKVLSRLFLVGLGKMLIVLHVPSLNLRLLIGFLDIVTNTLFLQMLLSN